MFLINHRQLFARNACIFTYSSPSGQDENMHAGCAQLYPTWSSIRILPASPSPAVPNCGWMGFVPPGSNIRCLRVSSPCSALCEWQKARGPRVSKLHTKQSFPSFANKACGFCVPLTRLQVAEAGREAPRESDSEQVYCQEAQDSIRNRSRFAGGVCRRKTSSTTSYMATYRSQFSFWEKQYFHYS